MLPCVKSKSGQAAGLCPGSAFKPLTPDMHLTLAPFLETHPHSLSGYTWNCLAAWNTIYAYKWCCPEEGTLLLSCALPSGNERVLLQPLGNFTAAVQERLLHAAGDGSHPLMVVGVDNAFLEANPSFSSHFTIQEDRGSHNYIYAAQDLALLAGRRYARKRNLLSQAAHAYAWTVEPLTRENSSLCTELLREIREEANEEMRRELALDDRAVENAVTLFAHLTLQGVLVRVQDKVAAFSIFEPQTPDTAVIHFERALRRYKGLHQVVNQAGAEAIRNLGFSYINREEDLGDPGLRQSKESYFPVRMAEAFVLTHKG